MIRSYSFFFPVSLRRKTLRMGLRRMMSCKSTLFAGVELILVTPFYYCLKSLSSG
jgi:hypothetical protein